MLLSGGADVAAIDCIVYALLARHRPHLIDGVRVVTQTMSAPVGPYVTRVGVTGDGVARLRDGLARAMGDSSLASARDDLLIGGIEVLAAGEYQRIAEIEAEAGGLKYRDFERPI
jgi:ABC-type phosphate/phosphonate transport system substrate-binding protein